MNKGIYFKIGDYFEASCIALVMPISVLIINILSQRGVQGSSEDYITDFGLSILMFLLLMVYVLLGRIIIIGDKIYVNWSGEQLTKGTFYLCWALYLYGYFSGKDARTVFAVLWICNSLLVIAVSLRIIGIILGYCVHGMRYYPHWDTNDRNLNKGRYVVYGRDGVVFFSTGNICDVRRLLALGLRRKPLIDRRRRIHTFGDLNDETKKVVNIHKCGMIEFTPSGRIVPLHLCE